MSKVSKLINNLSWDMPEDLQKSAINQLELINENELPLLIQPKGKECWENAAKVLGKIGYPRVKLIIPELLEWLKDMNWPGSWTIMELLEGIDRDELLPHIESALIKATKEDDDIWISAIKELVERTELTELDFSSHDIFRLLDLGE